MKKKKNLNMIKSIGALVLIWAMTSCVGDNLDSCRTKVRFEYTYNMANVNTFGQQAQKVRLYVFDKEGTFLKMYEDEGEQVSKDGYALAISDLNSDDYQYVAWARSMSSDSPDATFTLPEMIPNQSTIKDLQASLPTDDSGTRTNELNNLLVGYVSTRFTNKASEGTVVVNMKKVNKNFRVVLIGVNGTEELKEEDYKISILSQNGSAGVGYDYSISSHKELTYKPFLYKKLNWSEAITKVADNEKVLVGEIATSRLITQNNVRLVIQNKNDVEILNEDLANMLAASKPLSASAWSVQEYLDRQDYYPIIIYMNGNTSMWTRIVINDWYISNNAIVDP